VEPLRDWDDQPAAINLRLTPEDERVFRIVLTGSALTFAATACPRVRLCQEFSSTVLV
jgi:hypothetical protein